MDETKDILAEVDEKYIRVSNPLFTGDFEEAKTVELDKDTGVLGVYCVELRKVKTYLFDKERWTVADAKDWVVGHMKDSSQVAIKASVAERDEKGMMAVASEEVEDRDGEVIRMDGWQLRNFKENPVLLWMHNRNPAHNGLPIGRASDIRVRNVNGRKLLTFRPEYDDSTEFNRAVKKMAEGGLLNTFSVGFLPKERDGNVYTKQELLEISQVPIPSLSTASFIQRGKEMGFGVEKLYEFIDIKSAIPFRSYPPASEGRGWDAPAATSRMKTWAKKGDDMDMGQYKEGFTWYEPANKDNFGAYKLPHHDVEGGKLITVWRGVVAAMAAIMGARGGVAIPDDERKSVYNHLVEHYKQFDRTPPEFKLIESGELKEMFEIEEEQIEKKSFREFKKALRQIKQVMNEMRDEKRKAVEQSKIDSERAVALVLKSIGTKITGSLKDESSQGKGGIIK
jgi:hypothetical protein